ncbi:hypothetical protein TALC_00654 [Thermoplasmatales archaeon BRNA1]|nr:hypothetical protein TALC_00654 [Thermoplasmatales archaeon BRNA1]
MFGLGGSNVPKQVKEAKMSKWYGSLSNQNQVKLKRYLDFADTRDEAAFVVSVCKAAIDDHNYKFAVAVYESVSEIRFDAVQKYDVNEAAILAYFNTEQYDECMRLCDLGLEMLRDTNVRNHVLDGKDVFPEEVNCRNYKINVMVGVQKRYDESNGVLDQYVADGLISAEEAEYRKNSIKTYRLQRTFDGIFSQVPKNQ